MGTLTARTHLSLSLLTDLYQLTMAYGYFKAGLAEREAVFHMGFRKNPFKGGYVVSCGLADVIDLVESFHFSEEDTAYLATLTGNDGKPLFDKEFLAYLRKLKLTLDLDAVEEGTAVFPHEPLVRVKGSILQCQLLETALLALMNFQSLIATKAARICYAAKGEPVLEFGLRRAQGIDGALEASRAAYVGGCFATSNVLAGRLYGIPVRGTHAHSWVMAFHHELEAFEAYADAMPANCIFLVDTYDTLEGVRHAVEVGKKLRARGYEMAGVRLDSGDLAWLSIEARKILDEGGFPKAAVVASNDLDEHLIQSLKDQGAQINVWGVGTKLITAHDDPALGGVYKLSAIKDPAGKWVHRLKLSEQLVKVSTPGILQVRRFEDAQGFAADMVWDTLTPVASAPIIVDPLDPLRRRRIEEGWTANELLVPVFRGGQKVYDVPPLAQSRARATAQLDKLHGGIKRFANPHRYPVGLEGNLHELKAALVLESRGFKAREQEAV